MMILVEMKMEKISGSRGDSESIEDLVEEVIRGRIKLHEIERYTNGDHARAVEVRRRAIERITGVKLEHISKFSIDPKRAMEKNIENMIGAIQIPLGIAGPLRINGETAIGDFYIPLATTEGALVASVNRGCSAITRSGGAYATLIKDGQTRAPVFNTPSIRNALELVKWVEENFQRLKEAADSTSRFVRLKRIEPFIVGPNVFLRFVYTTGDANGMNGVTIATEKAVELIEKELDFAKCISLSGNLCTDKKPSAIDMILGRARSVVAEAVIKRSVVEEKLKCKPEDIHAVNYLKNWVGSALAGSYGFNAHFANIIGAIFLATGQDEAHIVEGSLGFTYTQLTERGDLYISVTLPDLQVGTVGGGTQLETQREALSIMGVAGGGDPPGANCRKFAEIVACAVLAGELSLLAALAAGHLARAHLALGRGLRDALQAKD